MGNKKITFAQIKRATDNRDAAGQPLNFYPIGYISPYVSYFFARFLPFTPNQISFIWGFLGIIGFAVMALGGYWNMLIGAIIYHVALLLDYVDGEISRASYHTTIGGTYLDKYFYYIHRGLLFLGMGLGVYNTTGKIAYFYLGLVTCLFILFDNMAKLRVYEALVSEKRLDVITSVKSFYVEEGNQNFQGSFFKRIKSYVLELLRPGNPFCLWFWAIVFNFVEYYLVLMVFLSFILLLRSTIKIYQQIGNIPTKKALNN